MAVMLRKAQTDIREYVTGWVASWRRCSLHTEHTSDRSFENIYICALKFRYYLDCALFVTGCLTNSGTKILSRSSVGAGRAALFLKIQSFLRSTAKSSRSECYLVVSRSNGFDLRYDGKHCFTSYHSIYGFIWFWRVLKLLFVTTSLFLSGKLYYIVVKGSYDFFNTNDVCSVTRGAFALNVLLKSRLQILLGIQLAQGFP